MALEQFGTETAHLVNEAANLCHDMTKKGLTFPPMRDKGIWEVEVGQMDGWLGGDEPDKIPCVVIKLGIG